MRHKIVITMGDPSGIGAEIAVKALEHGGLYDKCIPVLIGDRIPVEEAINFTSSKMKLNRIENMDSARGEKGVIDLIDLGIMSKGSWEYKKVCRSSGEASFQYVVKGIEIAMNREADAVVTGPINKESINLAGHHYSGHTEIFADYTKTKAYGMLLISKDLRVIHVTTHVSMRDACDIIRNNPDRVEQVIRLANDAMLLLGIDRPRIAVAGLNAHCSENGLFGDEEKSIEKAIAACKGDDIDADGPVPPDTTNKSG
mgnify:CR=1 FL=1